MNEMNEETVSQQQADRRLIPTQTVLQQKSTDEIVTGTSYDFGQAIKLSADHKYHIDEQMNRLCSVLSRTLGVYLNTEVNLVVQSTTQATYNEYAASLPSPIIAAAFELSPYAPSATWQIDAPVAYAIIDCMIGGTGSQVEIPDREATVLEAAMISQLCDEMLNTWSTTWGELKSASLQVQEVVTSAGRIENINASQEYNYIGVIGASIAGVEGRMNISMPASGLQPLLQHRKQQIIDKDMGAMLLDVVGRARVPISVTFGTQKKSIEELSQLQEGSIIDLDHHVDDPLFMLVSGRFKFRAEPGVQRGRLAVKVRDRRMRRRTND